jgi:putative acetyltransferase
VNAMSEPSAQFIVREFQAGDETAFARLNRAWIEKFFRLEQKDLATLEDPRKYILERGGQVFLAVCAAETVGCIAIVRLDTSTCEIVKMAVDDRFQGRGIGRALMYAAIAFARQLGAQRVWLETNHVLTPAIRLYESCGFRHLPKEECMPSPYDRSDVQMELRLVSFDTEVVGQQL